MAKVSTITHNILSGLGVIFLILIILGVIIFKPFSCNNDAPIKLKCADKIKPDTTKIEMKYGEEDFKQFHFTFINKHNFQLNRVKFPVQGIMRNNAWAGKQLTPCNWRDLSKYYNDSLTYNVRIDTAAEILDTKNIYIYETNKTFKPLVEITYQLDENRKWFLTKCIYN